MEAKYAGTTIKAPVFEMISGRFPKDRPRQDDIFATQTCSLDGVVVAAFICKRVPKSPDPDPGLKWG